MEYHEAANVLFDLRRYPPRMDLEPTRQLLGQLGDPQTSLRFVQVAGSNGKGSTARLLESVLREAGLDVGLYTSPELDDIRERVRIDGRILSKAAVVEYVETIEPYLTARGAEGSSPTFFESTTALAMWAFARADVDVAVLEVGIGGEYDSTSVVTPEASAVTCVTLEHADVLGDSIPEIARDKAAVAPPERKLVTAADGEALSAIEERAGETVRVGAEESADVRAIDRGIDGTEQAVELVGDGFRVETRLSLLGSHQVRNAGVAAALARQVADPTDEEIALGLRKAEWPGRFELLDTDPLVALDGAHNPAGCAALTETLSSFDYGELHLVFGALADKDHAGMAAALPSTERVYAVRSSSDRAEVTATIAAVFDGAGHSVEKYDSVESALGVALETAGPNDAVVVAGSLTTVAEARRRWFRRLVPKRIESREDASVVLDGADVDTADIERVADDGVHRAFESRLQPRQAELIRRELVDVGGECAVSGVDGDPFVDVVLFGTTAELRRLADRLDGREWGIDAFGAAIRDGLDDGAATYPWGDQTAIMGILNVTPDSFHDGGCYEEREDAIERGREMVAAGADIVDVGGESTRPGAEPVSAEREMRRVVPVIEALAELDCVVSIDTRKPEVAAAALQAGADMLNDVTGLESPEMRKIAADHDVPVVVMHSIDAPVDPDTEVDYDDVVEETIDALAERIQLAERAGIDRSRIVVDPGLGFGKNAAESFELLDRLGEFRALGCPVLVGHSHKSMFGLIGCDTGGRAAPTIAATAMAADRGADIVRVHDVEPNVAAVRTAAATIDPGRFDDA